MFKSSLVVSLAISLAVWCALPGSAQDPGSIDLHSAKVAAKSGKYPVFFVTNRQINTDGDRLSFTNERSNALAYGEYLPGQEPDVKLDSSTVRLVGTNQEFVAALKATGAKRVAVFVHGYRKSFAGSLDFAERIGAELNMPVVLFAWPSKNKYSAYMIDECTAEWSSHQLATVLKDLGDCFGNDNLSLISHSLGARVVNWSLRLLAAQNQLDKPFGCNLFFSPDMDRDTFLAESAFLKRTSARVQVYLDPHDTRIWLSKVLHGSPRLGTMDSSEENQQLTAMFQFDTSMPSHHIPYPLLSAAVRAPLRDVPMVRN